MLDYYVGSGLKGLIYIHLHVCFHVCSVLFCHVMYGRFVCILYAYICMYLCICIFCIFVCVCIYVCASVHIYIFVSMYVLVHTVICIKVICLPCRYLGGYLLVWHCHLGSILALSFEFQNLNTTISTKTSNKSTSVI